MGWRGIGLFDVGITAGALGRTTTYDDDFKIGVISPLIGIDGGISFPLGHTFDAGARAQLLFPFVGANQDYSDTSLKTLGTIEGVFGAAPCIGSCRLNFYGAGGIAIGAESAGSSYPGTSYSDTEKMLGFTVSGGAQYLINRRMSISAEVGYLDLSSTKFASPYGSYSLSESGITGSVGIDYHFGGKAHAPAPPPP